MAYFQIEPFGEDRADLRAGIIASTIYAMNKGKGGRAMSPADFMPKFDTKPTNSAELQAKLDALFVGMQTRMGVK